MITNVLPPFLWFTVYYGPTAHSIAYIRVRRTSAGKHVKRTSIAEILDPPLVIYTTDRPTVYSSAIYVG